MTEKDKELIMDAAMALEFALKQAEEKGENIGDALNRAQALLAELSAAGFTPSENSADIEKEAQR